MKWDGDGPCTWQTMQTVIPYHDTRKIHRKSGAMEFQLYSMHPDHSAYFIDFYSKEGDLILDVLCRSWHQPVVGACAR